MNLGLSQSGEDDDSGLVSVVVENELDNITGGFIGT